MSERIKKEIKEGLAVSPKDFKKLTAKEKEALKRVNIFRKSIGLKPFYIIKTKKKR